jgi:hypothetical protein
MLYKQLNQPKVSNTFLSSHYSELERTNSTYTRVTGRHYVSVDGQHCNETADWRCKLGISWLTLCRSLCRPLLESVELQFESCNLAKGATNGRKFSKFLHGYLHKGFETLTTFDLQLTRTCLTGPLGIKFEQHGMSCLINRSYFPVI